MKALEEKVYALKEMGLNARAIHFLFLILILSVVVCSSFVHCFIEYIATDTMVRHLKNLKLDGAFLVGNRRTFWWCIAISPLTLYLGL